MVRWKEERLAGAALLELVCRRIDDLGQPAYVKNSELRYVAVNASYAAFFNLRVSDFIGRRSRELFDAPEEEDREDKERRALIFGSEEIAICAEKDDRGHRRVAIESFFSDEERPYILGIFSAPADLRPVRPTDDADLLRALLDDLPVPVFARDEAHRLVFANRAYFQETGFSKEESLGKTDSEMLIDGNPIGNPDAATIHARISQALSKAQPVETEEMITARDGRTYPILVRTNRIVSKDDRYFAAGSFLNMQSLKVSEKEVLEAKRKAETAHRELARTLRALPIGIIVLNERYDIVSISDEFLRIWPIPLDESLEGRPFLELIRKGCEHGLYKNGQTAEEIFAQRVALIEQGDHDATELVSGDGQHVLFWCRHLSKDRILLSYSNITPIRMREREAQEARAALTSLGELMHDATQAIAQGMLIARDGVILLASKSVADVLQVPADYLQAGLRWRHLFRFCARRGDFGADPRRALSAWRPLIAQRRPILLPPYQVGGRWVKMEASFTEKQHWVAVFTDVTDTVEKEGDLHRLLTLAEAADRTKSEFLANMGHEIRTPMNGVLAMAELLARTNLEPRQQTFVDVIVKSGRALLTIINDILDFSRIEAGDMKLRKTVFDPLDAAEDVATLLSAPAAEKNIQLLVRGGPHLPTALMGDAGRFRQILTNLVGNAIKFTERGHVLIDLGWVQGAGDEIMLILRVEDTGIGIAPASLQTIFDKFSHADTPFVRRHEGTGLGLAITAGLVDLFGGYIDVVSEVGKGSVFTAHLPMICVRSTSGRKHMPSMLKGARVLVIDSEDVSRQILVERLAFAQFDVVGAENGSIALAILKEAARLDLAVDAVVVDNNFAGQEGFDVVELIRRDHQFQTLPIVLLASMDMSESVSDMAVSRCHTCLMKPVRANILLKAVEDAVRAARSTSAAGVLIAAVDAERCEEAPDAAQVSSRPQIDILVAEDNEVNQIVFTQILQSAGFRFQVVGDGRQAVQAWEDGHPRLIMMDVSMPVMDGLDAARMIRQREGASGARVAIIGVTAHARQMTDHELRAAGMDDYIVKPISPEILEEKIDHWLNADAKPSLQGSARFDAT